MSGMAALFLKEPKERINKLYPGMTKLGGKMCGITAFEKGGKNES